MDDHTSHQNAMDDAARLASQGFERGVTTFKDGVANATAGFAQTQAQMKGQMESLMKTAEQVVTFSQGNVEAVMKSNQILLAGLQELGRHMATSAQAAIEESVTAYRATASVKSVKEAVDLQSAHAKSAFSRTVADAGRLSDATVKLAEQAIAPISARVSLAVEMAGRAG